MAYLVLVDAQDGSVLFRKSLTDFQTQSASYAIYNGDSPAPFSPATTVPGVGAQAPLIPRTTVTLIGNEGVNSFNSLGWMSDGTNLTDGNNVEAGIDVDGTNGVDTPLSDRLAPSTSRTTPHQETQRLAMPRRPRATGTVKSPTCSTGRTCSTIASIDWGSPKPVAISNTATSDEAVLVAIA